jgi:hypothetical protein
VIIIIIGYWFASTWLWMADTLLVREQARDVRPQSCCHISAQLELLHA